MFSDKRQTLRYPVSHRLDVSFGKQSPWEALGLNLSDGGILCRTKDPIGLYAQVKLHLHLGESPDSTLCCEGTVIRVERAGEEFLSGIEFKERLPNFDQIIEKHLNLKGHA